MKYHKLPTWRCRKHVGVLMVNLGTPDAPTKKALKTYLKELVESPTLVVFGGSY